MDYIARTNRINSSITTNVQSIKTHSENVSKTCGNFTYNVFNSYILGELVGLLHDIGKYSDDFQRKIKSDNSIKVKHSYLGAFLVNQFFAHSSPDCSGKSLIIRNAAIESILSHHTRIENVDRFNALFSDLVENPEEINTLSCVNQRFLSEFSKELIQTLYSNLLKCDFSANLSYYKQYLSKSSLDLLTRAQCEINMFSRMLFSSLIDADRLDAMAWEYNIPINIRKLDYQDSLFKLNSYLFNKKNAAGSSKINNIRNQIYDACVNKAYNPQGFFSLLAPTGSGKTLASLGFAVNHAKAHSLNRIIYVAPFTTIIDQTSEIYRDIFGNENVTEVHSSYDKSTKNEKDAHEYELMSSNFDSPIITTTNNQLFNALFKNDVRSLRKLHNISKSVIILDEIQALPVKYLRPCLLALEILVKDYDCTVLLSSATMYNYSKDNLLLSPINEIINSPQQYLNLLKRTNCVDLHSLSVEEISNKLNDEHRALCIVNTKKHTKEIYKTLIKLGKQNVYHLSTNMHMAHRKRVLDRIFQILDDKENEEPIILVSTQLIEAGIDISFPSVYRSFTGLESMIQSCGRCNRHGEFPIGNFFVFTPKEREYHGYKELEDKYRIAKQIFSGRELDINDLDIIENYFRRLNYEGLHENLLKELLGYTDSCKVSFHPEYHSIAETFNLIEEYGIDVVVDDDADIHAVLKFYEESDFKYRALTSAQKYLINSHTVRVTEKVFNNIGTKELGAFFITDKYNYNEHTGIGVDSDDCLII